MNWWYAIQGERLCRVRHVDNRQHVDGTVQLTLPRLADLSLEDGGLFEVHDEQEGMVYLAQTLSCWHEAESLVVVCTPLGTRVERARGEMDWDDDYLVVPGCEPVELMARVEASSQCPKGDHVRIDLMTSAWATLPLHLGGARGCACYGCQEGAGGASPQVWDFRPVHAGPGGPRDPEVELILLRDRLRLDVTIDMARQGEFVTTVIGHVRSRRGLKPFKEVMQEAKP